MKLFILYCFVFSLSGTTLYFVKLSLDEKHELLKTINKEILYQEKRRILLSAELEYLSRAERILSISKETLNMEAIGYDRILPLQSIPMRRKQENPEITKIQEKKL
mgnify:CR=1 FL=1